MHIARIAAHKKWSLETQAAREEQKSQDDHRMSAKSFYQVHTHWRQRTLRQKIITLCEEFIGRDVMNILRLYIDDVLLPTDRYVLAFDTGKCIVLDVVDLRRWVACLLIPEARPLQSLRLVDDCVVGRSADGNMDKFNLVTGVYHRDCGPWKFQENVLPGRYKDASNVRVGKSIFSMGGLTYNPQCKTMFKSSGCAVLTENKKWQRVPDMRCDRSSHCALLVNDKFIFVFGGTYHKQRFIEVFDIQLQKWQCVFTERNVELWQFDPRQVGVIAI
jgi:hypothetical protein